MSSPRHHRIIQGKGLEGILLARCRTEEGQICTSYLDSLSESLQWRIHSILKLQCFIIPIKQLHQLQHKKNEFLTVPVIFSTKSCFAQWKIIIICTLLDFSSLELTIPLPSDSISKHLYIILLWNSHGFVFLQAGTCIKALSVFFNISLLEFQHGDCESRSYNVLDVIILIF